MIHALHTTEDFIYAYVVFDTVDAEGRWKDKGDFIYVSDMWIHKNYRGWNTLAKLIRYIDNYPETIHAKGVYWESERYTGKTGRKISKLYQRNRFFKIGEKL